MPSLEKSGGQLEGNAPYFTGSGVKGVGLRRTLTCRAGGNDWRYPLAKQSCNGGRSNVTISPEDVDTVGEEVNRCS